MKKEKWEEIDDKIADFLNSSTCFDKLYFEDGNVVNDIECYDGTINTFMECDSYVGRIEFSDGSSGIDFQAFWDTNDDEAWIRVHTYDDELGDEDYDVSLEPEMQAQLRQMFTKTIKSCFNMSVAQFVKNAA